MPDIADHPFDPEQEAKYRRGYAHGVSSTISGLLHLLSNKNRKAVEVWFGDQLAPWVNSIRSSAEPPPDFPVLRQPTRDD